MKKKVCLTGLLLFATFAAEAQVMDLEILPLVDKAMAAQVGGGKEDVHSGVEIRRLDFLLSGLALKRMDGTWVESEDWTAFYSLGKRRFKAQAEGIPEGRYSAVRFDVGVTAAQDAADVNLWPADHALHPDVCGLHWGWQGGYVYLALEGHWTRADGVRSGFSYHLARQPNVVRVKVPVDFQGGGPMTLKLALDAARLLRGIDFAKDGNSTHSREGDSVLPRLKENLAEAFRAEGVYYDRYQSPDAAVAVQTASLPEGTHPYPAAITQRLPQVRLPADNPLTVEGVALGEKLFHDPRLSINNRQSCASCHQRDAAFSDPQAFSLGAEGVAGKRNSMPLFNLAWNQAFFWDGRAKTLREQVLMPIQDRHEMNERLDRVVEKLAGSEGDFAAAFGRAEITQERIAQALEQYLLTLVSQESRFDRAARKVAQMTEEEKLGLQLFVTEHDPARGLRGADCFHCHGSTLFTNHQFKNNGLDLESTDLGRMLVTGDPADRGKFKTPSLRNIAVTGPYMHDGRFKTLEEVVEHYNSGVQRSETLDPNLAKHPDGGLQLTPAEKRALVAFLKTLTDEEFISQPATRKLANRP